MATKELNFLVGDVHSKDCGKDKRFAYLTEQKYDVVGLKKLFKLENVQSRGPSLLMSCLAY